MEFSTIGRTGIHVSNLCFGTMSFGGNADEETSNAMYKQCREAGINFLILRMCIMAVYPKKF